MLFGINSYLSQSFSPKRSVFCKVYYNSVLQLKDIYLLVPLYGDGDFQPIMAFSGAFYLK